MPDWKSIGRKLGVVITEEEMEHRKQVALAREQQAASAQQDPEGAEEQAALVRERTLPCPECDGELVGFDHLAGHYCSECGWDLPKVYDGDPEDDAPVVEHVAGLLRGPRVRISEYSLPPLVEMSKQEWDGIVSGSLPAFLGRETRLSVDHELWWYKGRFWTTEELGLSPEVFQLAAEGWEDWQERRQGNARQREEEDLRIQLAEERAAEARRQAKLAWADAKLSGESSRREPIPRDVRLDVFRRDGGRCVECSADFDLQYDHIIPLSMGGSNSVANLQLLCGDCNRRKGGTLG